MSLPLEDLEYQRQAVASVIGLLDGLPPRSMAAPGELFGNASPAGDLGPEALLANKRRILEQNGIPEEDARLADSPDVCIEMETGTGKTLVYFRTIYELFRAYRLTKFIILVPSIAIREGVLSTFENFRHPLRERYQIDPACFEYDSGKLSRLRQFIGDSQPQIMVMTIQSITAEDRIINQTGRDDSQDGLTYLQALGRCRPVIIMDEPQEGMDTETAQARLATLDPLLRLRYSATHKVVQNLLFRLTPFEAYRQGMVKKIEVLTVAERNDEATLKIELAEIQTSKTGAPRAKLNLWRKQGEEYKWKPSNWLRPGDDLEAATDNISYRGFRIERIYKGLQDQKWHVTLGNGIDIIQRERASDFSGLFRQQLEWAIRRHFQKKLGLDETGTKSRPGLVERGIKPVALIFIDRVDSYVRDDGLIRLLFHEIYPAIHREILGTTPTPEQITAAQGYYFARTAGGEYTDSENAMLRNTEVFDQILRDKETLLRLDNPIEFIFTHSALGVGWDNPNVFTIATLNQSYNDDRKRQQIGRGLRICRDQDGRRIYDPEGVREGEEINQLTIIPNESYESFAQQYQKQLEEVYGPGAVGPKFRQSHKGKSRTRLIRRTAHFESAAFRDFWAKLARKTRYTVAFREEEVVRRSIEALNTLTIGEYAAEVRLTRVGAIHQTGLAGNEVGRETVLLRAAYSPLDLVEEISENTSLSYPSALRIAQGIENTAAAANPHKFLLQACARIRAIELDEMLRSLTYHPTGETVPLEILQETVRTHLIHDLQPTPNRGVYDHVLCDSGSEPERNFARAADADSEVVCFLKLPGGYTIPTPIGDYTPDFGLILRRRSLRDGAEQEFYFVIETKSTSDIDDTRSLTESERARIKCALKHFQALGIEARLSYLPYRAPVRDYEADFKARIGQAPSAPFPPPFAPGDPLPL